jgi:hypothetical protein
MAPRYRPADQVKGNLALVQAIPWDTINDHAVSASGSPAVVTLPADAMAGNTIRQIFASYSAAPAAGVTIKIEDGAGNVVWQQAFPPNASMAPFTFDPAKTGTRNTATIITLDASLGLIAYLDVESYIQD